MRQKPFYPILFYNYMIHQIRAFRNIYFYKSCKFIHSIAPAPCGRKGMQVWRSLF